MTTTHLIRFRMRQLTFYKTSIDPSNSFFPRMTHKFIEVSDLEGVLTGWRRLSRMAISDYPNIKGD